MLIEFCLPVYNEEQILKSNVLMLLNYCRNQNFNFDWQIVIIVNGSSDATLNISKNLSQQYHKFIKYINIKKAGRGQALKRYWLSSQADIVSYMDIDLAVSLENISDLIFPIIKNEVDLVIGSRLLPNSNIKRSFLRELSSQGYNFLSRLILEHKFSDLQCGFKAIKLNKFKTIASYIKNEQWFFDTELVIWAKYFNFKIKEIPVNWEENRYDKRKSKVNIVRDSIKFLINLIKLKRQLKQKSRS